MDAPVQPISPLEIRLFGPFDVQVDGRPLPKLGSRKRQWLLALLTLRHGREVHRSWLAGTLWPESAEPQAQANLRQSLADLRRALGAQAWRIHSVTSRTLSLDLQGAYADIPAFDESVALSDSQSLKRAVALYSGPLLEGCMEEWVVQERDSREQAYLNALETMSQVEEAQGNINAAVEYLRQAIRIDPLRETAQRKLMELHAKVGDFAAANQVYFQLRAYLHREMNMEPSPETIALFEGIRQSGRTRAQLHAFGIPEAKETPGWPKVTGHGRLISQPANKLPVRVTAFIGRKKELAELCSLLRHARLVTLMGTGGVGKTRLAIEAASLIGTEYADGVLFVELASISDPSLVSQTITRALNIPQDPAASLEQTLAQALSRKQMLLVIDNCEHLTAACAFVAGTLVTSCPQVTIVATSRERLGVEGEALYRVPSLSCPEPQQALSTDSLEQSEAVQLFIDRAKSAAPHLGITEREYGEIATICRRVDGIPLAIELAAARVRHLGLTEISKRLDDCFRLLIGGHRASPQRHQTLRASVEWSYDLLDEQERLLLRSLSVFAGGWSLEAAEAICQAPDSELSPTIDLLSNLVDKSLVLADRQGLHKRYQLLETIRLYAHEKQLECDDGDEIRLRHYGFFKHLAESADLQTDGPGQPDWLLRLDSDYDNIRCALDWSRCGRVSAESGLQFVESLGTYWWIRGYLQEGRDYCVAALAYEDAGVQSGAKASALNSAALLAWSQGDFAAAREFHEDALVIWRALGDSDHAAASMNNLASVLREQGDYVQAEALFHEALAVKRAAGDPLWEAYVLGNLGLLHGEQGDFSVAKPFWNKSLELYKRNGSGRGVAWCLVSLAAIAYNLGDNSKATTLAEESEKTFRDLGDRVGLARTLRVLGMISQRQCSFEKAEHNFTECLALCRDLGDRRGLAATLEALASLAATHTRDYERAAKLWGVSEVLRETIGAPLTPVQRAAYVSAVEEARRNASPEAFETAWIEGRSLTFYQATALE